MRICIYGAGAIGGYLAVELALSGVDVTVIARGEQLAAIRRQGLKLLTGGTEKTARVACTDDPRSAGPQQYVILTVKAQALPAIAEGVATLLAPDTAIVTAQNGISWWYFYKLAGSWENQRLESVDPGGRIWAMLPAERAIGCVVYPSCEIIEPGVIRHLSGNRFMIGDPDGTPSPRVLALAERLTAAGFKAPVRRKIRDDIWLKLWGNVSFNPVSVLTQATLEEIARDSGTRAVVRAMMVEAQCVAERLGVEFAVDVDTRIGWAEAVGHHRTSMLQDFEAAKPLELEPLVTVVSELGRLVSVPTPTIDHVLALVRLRARMRQGAS
jgi:2-dehydropantoate 2-reductase